METVGPIRFEDINGNPTATATYDKHAFLRPFQIAFKGIWHEQNRQDGNVWVYRATGTHSGSLATDPAVKED